MVSSKNWSCTEMIQNDQRPPYLASTELLLPVCCFVGSHTKMGRSGENTYFSAKILGKAHNF